MVEAEEINEITRQQYELQGSWEKVRATALSRLEFLEVKEEIKSNLSVKQSSLLEKQPQVSSSIQSSTRVTQSSSFVTQSSSPVTQSSSFLTRSSAPISVSVIQTSVLVRGH